MKFLAKLDPMTVLLVVVIIGVAVTMSTQAATQTSTTEATAQVDSVDAPLASRHMGKS